MEAFIRSVPLIAFVLLSLTASCEARPLYDGAQRNLSNPIPDYCSDRLTVCTLEYDYEGHPFYTPQPSFSFGIPFIYPYRPYNERVF